MPAGSKRKIDTEALPEYSRRILAMRGSMRQGDFAAQLNVSPMAVSHWERGSNEPGLKMYLALAEMAEGDVRTFFLNQAAEKSGLIDLTLSEAARHTLSGISARLWAKRPAFVSIRLSSGFAGAGPAYEPDDVTEGDVMIPADLCPNAVDTRCIRIRGKSMEPALTDGTIAAVDLSAREIARLRGRIVAARHSVEGIVIKRLVFVGKEWRLVSDAAGYDTLKLQDGWQVIGKVVWWIQRAE